MDILVFALTGVLLIALIAACLLPVSADTPEDQGNGMIEVDIPRHVPTSRWRPRTLAFFGVTAIASLLFQLVRWLPALYAASVGNVADAITRDPATVNGYIARLRPALVFFGVAYIIGTALVLRANLGRRPTTSRITSPGCSARWMWRRPATVARSRSWCPTTAPPMTPPWSPGKRSRPSGTPAGGCCAARTGGSLRHLTGPSRTP